MLDYAIFEDRIIDCDNTSVIQCGFRKHKHAHT